MTVTETGLDRHGAETSWHGVGRQIRCDVLEWVGSAAGWRDESYPAAAAAADVVAIETGGKKQNKLADDCTLRLSSVRRLLIDGFVTAVLYTVCCDVSVWRHWLRNTITGPARGENTNFDVWRITAHSRREFPLWSCYKLAVQTRKISEHSRYRKWIALLVFVAYTC